MNHNFSGDRSKIRAQINRVQKEIQQRLKALQTEAADHLVNSSSSTNESRQMFEAVRELTNSKSTRPITVHNEEGNVIATDSEKAEVIRDWFKNHFTGYELPLEPFVGVPRPLDTPITQSEVESAVKRLKNNRACGPDGVPNELLKYAGENFCAAFSTIINQACCLRSSEKGLPLEWEYADDVDFCDEEEDVLRNLLPVCTEVLSEWGLNVNESKTEFVHLFLASKDEIDHDGKPLKDNEPWRSSKSLGSLLCSVADIKHRIVLANSAFQIYKKVWLEKSKIPLAKKLIVYEAQVVSVLLYNCACWSAPKNVLNTFTPF
ncbi:hypothetical protein ACHWQZ_G000942 [Mnemiopsis leidyi]